MSDFPELIIRRNADDTMSVIYGSALETFDAGLTVSEEEAIISDFIVRHACQFGQE